LKERTVWEVRKRRERMRGARGFIGERERVTEERGKKKKKEEEELMVIS
jgi:hypothetical protein